MNQLIELKDIAQRIYTLRGVKVMLDRDLAELYDVETRVLNQAVRRHLKRFPQNFMFQLSKPYRCKSRRAPESRRQGRSRSQPTASPWQRRIWSPPAFPRGRKDGIRSTRSSIPPWVYCSNGFLICQLFNVHKAL